MQQRRDLYRLLLIWLTFIGLGCAAPVALPINSPTGEVAAAEEAAANGTIPGLSISAWSVDGDFAKLADSFLANVPQPQLWTTVPGGKAATLVFQTGHGDPDKLQNGTVPWEVVQPPTRYLIQAICQTMAHGPQWQCSDGELSEEYGCPGDWKAEFLGDTAQQRSVYDRWGKNYLLANPDTRMICGNSTLYTPREKGILSIWDNYSGPKYQVADAILEGLNDLAVSICLTKGGPTPDKSPLTQDKEFVTLANEYADDYYHVLYSKPFLGKNSKDPTIFSLQALRQADNTTSEIRRELEALEGEDPGAAKTLSNELLAQSEMRTFPRCLPSLVVSPDQPIISQAMTAQLTKNLYIDASEEAYFANQTYVPGGRAALEDALIDSASSQAAELGLFDQIGEFVPDFVYGRHLLLAIIPVDEALRLGNITVTEKNSIVTFRRQIDLERIPDLTGQEIDQVQFIKKTLVESGFAPSIYVLGPGGHFSVQLNQDRSPINTFLVRRPVAQISEWLKTQAPSEAFLAALTQLEGLGPDELGLPAAEPVDDTIKRYYDPFILDAIAEALYPDRRFFLESWSWGYYERAGFDLKQDQMWLGYEFRFVPKAGVTPITPVSLWIDASLGEVCIS